MDPFIVFLVSICLILIAFIIVNFYFFYLHTEFTITTFTAITQTHQTYTAEAKVQTANCFDDHHYEQSTQTILNMKTATTGADYVACRDSTVQAVELNYVDIHK